MGAGSEGGITVVWRFTSPGSGGWTFDQLSQQVLVGDSATAIT